MSDEIDRFIDKAEKIVHRSEENLLQKLIKKWTRESDSLDGEDVVDKIAKERERTNTKVPDEEDDITSFLEKRSYRSKKR